MLLSPTEHAGLRATAAIRSARKLTMQQLHAGLRATAAINLRAIRSARKLTMQQLADRLDVSLQQLSKWERGENAISLVRVEQIAAALDVPPAELLGFGSVATTIPAAAFAAREILALPQPALEVGLCAARKAAELFCPPMEESS